MPHIVRAIDVGFGQTKYVSAVGDNDIECAHFPSVAIPSLVDTSRSTVLGGRRRTVAVPVGPMFYEVGHDIGESRGQVGRGGQDALRQRCAIGFDEGGLDPGAADIDRDHQASGVGHPLSIREHPAGSAHL